jgi:hypothetical protein
MNKDTPKFDPHSYAEFERKMQLFENGPTTTIFEQLAAKGVALPPPDAIADSDIKTRLWEVLAALHDARVELDYTDHLSDRELYATLWNHILPNEVPAINELGYTEHFQMLLCTGEEPQTSLYLRYFADEKERGRWQQDNPEYVMPPQEDPPYNRDVLLPSGFSSPEALAWLDANWNPRALAVNRFGITQHARSFVEQLYAAGATEVGIDNITMLPEHSWTPYADELIVVLPSDENTRQALLAFVHDAGRPARITNVKKPFMAEGPDRIRLGWA